MGALAAESYAIKDAAEKFGKIFGKGEINRKNGMDYAEALNSRIVYYDISASDDQKRYIERFIPTSTFDEDQRTRIEREYLITGHTKPKCALRHYSKPASPDLRQCPSNSNRHKGND